MRLNPEESILLTTSRPFVRDHDVSALDRLVTPKLDWGFILWRSEAYRTTPLVHYHLERLKLLGRAPEPVRAYLSNWARLSAARTTALTHELLEVVDAFTSRDIEFHLIKGVAIAPFLYPDAALRPMLDVDVMIHPEDIPSARRVMTELGYQHGIWDPETNQVDVVEYAPVDMVGHHELPAYHSLVRMDSPVRAELVPEPWRRKHLKCFFHNDGTVDFLVFVDLHFNLSVGFDQADVWRGVRSESLLNRTINLQSLTTMLWFFAARLYNEAFQFNTSKLIMFGDAHTILERAADAIDWDELVSVAEKYEMQPSLYYVLAHLANLTGAPIPEDVVEALRPDKAAMPHVNDWGDVLPKLFSRSVVEEVVLA